jgi:hypothetical protein
LLLPSAKKPALSVSSQQDQHEASGPDADDEDDEPDKCPSDVDGDQPDIEQHDDEGMAQEQETPSEAKTALVATDSRIEDIISSVECVHEKTEVTSVRVIPSSHKSTSSQSGSDGQSQANQVEKAAKSALHRIEVATGVQVSQKHRGALVSQGLQLAGRDALEAFRQVCSYWRRSHVSNRIVARAPSAKRHAALERFAQVYSTATDTTLHRAALDVLHRLNLAYLYDVYLETLEALSQFSLAHDVPKVATGRRALDIFDKDVRDVAQDQMFWACYPEHVGKPRFNIDRAFKVTLKNAEKWHTFRDEFGYGMLALVPPGINNWFEKLPLAYLPVFFYLIRTVNPVAVSMGEAISNRVLSSWKGDEPSERWLQIEHLDMIDDSYLRTNPMKLLEEVNVGCTVGGSVGRAVTLPAGDEENEAASLEAIFSSAAQFSHEGEDYQAPSSSFYTGGV